MERLKLNAKGVKDILTREEMKTILGGVDKYAGSGSGSCKTHCFKSEGGVITSGTCSLKQYDNAPPVCVCSVAGGNC
ncbi:MAG: hypothetical protein ACTJFN_08050 [Sphingobacterium sp.]